MKASVPLMLLSVYLFLLSSQANQFLLSYAGIALPLVAMVFGLLVIAYLSTGKALRFVHSPFLLPWMGMFIWWALASFTGIYPGRSVPFIVRDYGLRIQVLPFVICAIAESREHVRKAMVGVAMGLGVILIFCFTSGQMSEGRFFIPNTSLGNSNDLAMHIVLFSCLTISLLAGGKGPKYFLTIAMPIALFYVLKTGSRSNMLTVILLLLVGFIMLPGRQRITMVALAVILPLMIVPFLPSVTTARLGSFFRASGNAADAKEAELDANAVNSTNARLDLQLRALELTGENLLLGIGPLNFTDAVDEMVKKQGGLKSGWQVAHNSYLEVSAETGIPGMIFYIWNIVLCLKLNISAFKRFKKAPEDRTAFLVTFSLLAATCAYGFGVLFTTIPYDFQLAMLVGLTAAMNIAIQDQARLTTPAPTTGFSAPVLAGRRRR